MRKVPLWLKFGIGGIFAYSALLVWALIAYPKSDNLAVIYTPWVLSGLTGINFHEPAISHPAIFGLWALINSGVIFTALALIGYLSARAFRK
ncbi:MAG: hypothetical protein AB7V14_00830 [Kiritimatiellia bacterium]